MPRITQKSVGLSSVFWKMPNKNSIKTPVKKLNAKISYWRQHLAFLLEKIKSSPFSTTRRHIRKFSKTWKLCRPQRESFPKWWYFRGKKVLQTVVVLNVGFLKLCARPHDSAKWKSQRRKCGLSKNIERDVHRKANSLLSSRERTLRYHSCRPRDLRKKVVYESDRCP